MSPDIVIIIIFCVMGLVAHAATTRPGLEWVLRVIYGFAVVVEMFTLLVAYPSASPPPTPWVLGVVWWMTIMTFGMLFQPFRQLISTVLTVVNQFLCGRIFVHIWTNRKGAWMTGMPWLAERIFVPTSIPHLNGLWIYVTVVGNLLVNLNPENVQLPSIPFPMPVPIDSLFSYNFLGLILLAFCGCGIFVKRQFKEVLNRLGLVKPKPHHYAIAVAAIVGTLAYDYVFSELIKGMPGALGSKLSYYNAGTFSASGAGPAAVMALATGFFAGVGEEVLIRGALQPVFGVLPAGLLHGILHGQFNHAPLFILQVAGWSTIMGVVRRYTNTTTTIITHCGYNFIMTFLFAYAP